MLTAGLFAHTGWLAHVPGGWAADPFVVGGLVAAGWAYRRGSATGRRAHRAGTRRAAFWAGLVAVGVALLSPLDELAAQLASAHMVQHVVLILVAAPLLALSSPASTIVRGLPRRLRPWLRKPVRLSRVIRSGRAVAIAASVWLLHAGALWFWHASAPYEVALRNDIVHGIEHLSFLGTGLMFWAAVLTTPHRHGRLSSGHGALLVFTMALQSVLLSALLTFARSPWYESYRESTQRWGLDPLEDQQLAGAIMWVPAGLVYVGGGVALVAAWMRDIERRHDDPAASTDWSPGDRPGPPARISR